MTQDFFRIITVGFFTSLLLGGCGDSGQETTESTSVEGIRITSMNPALAEVDAPITISGQGFTERQDYIVSIGGNGLSVELEVIEWQDNNIVVMIPDDPRIQETLPYYFRIQSADFTETSNLFSFSFK